VREPQCKANTDGERAEGCVREPQCKAANFVDSRLNQRRSLNNGTDKT